MKLTTVIALVVLMICGSLQAVEKSLNEQETIYFQIDNGRFYNSAVLENNSRTLIVAVGQRSAKEKKSKRQGYVAILELKDKSLTIISEDLFRIDYNDRRWPGRVRTVAVVPSTGDNGSDIYVTGRGGTDEEGIGFFRHYTWKNNTLTPCETVILSQVQEGIVYTHGYSLKTGDVDGDGQQEAVYGGFFGKTINEHLSEDFADVRIFKKNARGKIEESSNKPFEQMRIPLRVNAMEVKDINGDSKAEIIIAGRSRMVDQEYSSFAISYGNHTTYHVNREQALPGRFRTVMAADIDGDGKDELITGGRVDLGNRMVADLQVWKLNPQGVDLLSRYSWGSDASTRARGLITTRDNNRFIAVGRTELLHQGDSPRWLGFVRLFQYKNGSVWPVQLPLLLDKGPETRIRDIKHFGTDRYLSSGFIMKSEKKSDGFIYIF